MVHDDILYYVHNIQRGSVRTFLYLICDKVWRSFGMCETNVSVLLLSVDYVSFQLFDTLQYCSISSSYVRHSSLKSFHAYVTASMYVFRLFISSNGRENCQWCYFHFYRFSVQ